MCNLYGPPTRSTCESSCTEDAARHRLGFDAWLHVSREQAEGLIRVPLVELMDHGQAESGNLVSLPS
jgi:hypothetical protein